MKLGGNVMSFDSERTYEIASGDLSDSRCRPRRALKALLSVVADQVGVLEENLAQLYDDQFIETCAPWVVPYIGGSHWLSRACTTLCQRSAVSVRRSRRTRLVSAAAKDTAAMLEHLPEDVTGWNARAVEFFNCSGGRNGRQITFAQKLLRA